MKPITRTIIAILGLGAVGAHAAVIVPATDASFTPTGTLLAINSTVNSTTLNTPEFTASPSGTITGPGAPGPGGRYWEPNGTSIGDEAAVFTNSANTGPIHTFTFNALDLPDGSIIHGIYVRWRAQGNQSSAVDYSYTEGLSSGTVTYNQQANETGASFSWTDSASGGPYTLGFQTLFSGENIVVGGGNGFTLTIGHNAVHTNNVIRTDALIIDATIIPEPSTALLGGLGFLALLRRRR